MVLLKIDRPESCRKCTLHNAEGDRCLLTGIRLGYAKPSCPLIPLTEYEEARINEILYERGEKEGDEEIGEKGDLWKYLDR